MGLCSSLFALLLGRKRRSARLTARASRTAVVRPPAALEEEQFLRTCIGCKQCADVCPNECITFRSVGGVSTPYVHPRRKPCILCMKCTQVCPSGALQRVASDDGDEIQKHVKMGVAVVDKNICNSYNGYACGACVPACPFRGQALSAAIWERPVVNEDRCVGCGLCEKACIVYPQAIRVIPQSVLVSGEASI